MRQEPLRPRIAPRSLRQRVVAVGSTFQRAMAGRHLARTEFAPHIRICEFGTRLAQKGRLMQSEGKSYQFDHLPVIDYDKHPAYGRVLSMPQLGARLKALVYFGYGFLLAVARRIVDQENLPRPADNAQKFGAILRNLPTYLRLIFLQRLARLAAGNAYKPKTERGADILTPLERDGITGVRFSSDKIAEIRNLLAPYFKTLEAKTSLPGRQDDRRVWLDPATAPDVYKWFNQTAADLGLLEAASAYLRRPVGVSHIAAELVDHAAAPASPFVDVGVDSSPADGFHIDSTDNLLKFLIYLSDVGPANGPLTYVVGSHRASGGFWDGLFRRANDLGGLSSTQPEFRELFYALPSGLQRKAAFGADLLPDSNFTASILSDQWSVTSDSEKAVLYDPFGIHRDAAVTQGRRSAVIIKLTELSR
jgi:hypothetical protein